MAASARDERLEMVERQLRARGIRDERVLDAVARVPRELFLPPGQQHLAYRDQAVPISHGQTISQPYMVAVMTEALAPRPDDRILEIGTGSGYQTAVLAHLAATVHTIERYGPLAARAREILEGEMGIANVDFAVGDGTRGWPEEAPFDAILVTAGAPSVPASLKEQISPDGGRLVIPIGPRGTQDLYRYVLTGTELVGENLLPCRFVPLVGEEGWEDEEWP